MSRVARRVATALIVGSLLVVNACGSGSVGVESGDPTGPSVAISHVTAGASAHDLDVHVLGTPADVDDEDPCYERYEVELEESEAEIAIEVVRVVEADYSRGGCANVDRVVSAGLDRPAGDRIVVDRHDGRRFSPGPDGYTTPTACGLEDLACQGLASTTTAVPAACTTESYRYAVASEIDGGHYGISNERCDGRWAAFDVDFGSDACLPEADADDPCRGARVHRTFWRNDGGRWRVLSYQGSGDCAEARAAAPEFPTDVCAVSE